MMMNSATRTLCSKTLNRMAVRSFSAECAPAQKVRCALDDYRKEHFSREIPSRFKKEIIKTLKGPHESIQVENLNLILTNIGRQDACLTAEEMNVLLKESGATDRCLPVEQIIKLL